MSREADLDELDRIWPLGKQLVVPDGGTVLVAGAYEGRYMHYVASRFKPGLIVGYEPQKEKAAIAKERLRGLNNVIVIDEGIGVHACNVAMERYGTDGCRVAEFTSKDMVRLNSIDHVMDGIGKPVDLFICNMEGYEVPLLAYLIATERIWEFTSLAVQFHSRSKMDQMITDHFGRAVYNDYPTWCYWLNDQGLTEVVPPIQH